MNGAISNAEEKRNIISVIGRDSFSVLSQSFTSAPIVQAFLLSLGVSNILLGTLNAMTNAALMLGMFLFMGRIDAISDEKIIQTNSKLFLTIGIFPSVLIFLCLTGFNIGSLWVFALAAAGWSIQSFFIGIRAMIDSKVIRNILRADIFGFVFGLDGIIFNSLCMLGAFLIKPLLDGLSGFGIVFTISLLLMPGSVYLNSKLRLVTQQRPNGDNGMKTPFNSFSYAFRSRKLRNASFLHILRGVVGGMFFFILPLGIMHYGIPLSYSAYIVIANAVAGIIGNIFISLFYDRIGTVKSVFIAVMLCLLALGCLVATRNPVFFLLLVSLFSTGQTIISQSVPLGVYKITPPDFIGTFTGIRFFIMQSAEAGAAFILGFLINYLSIASVLASIALFLILMFFFTKHSFGHDERGQSMTV